MSHCKIFVNMNVFWIILLKSRSSWMLAAEALCSTCCLSHHFEADSEANRFH